MEIRVVKLMLCSALSMCLLLASSGAAWAASQSTDGSLTAEALDSALYRPQHVETFGDTVQLESGGSSGSLFGEIGSIHQNAYVFGDLNGDGADDAVATVIESITGLGSGLEIVLAAYLNDSGSPTFLDSVALGRGTVVDSVTVESGIVTVAGLQMGPRDPFCCPKQAFVKQFKLDGTRLVAWSDAPAPGLPGTPDLTPARSAFSGQVLIPSPGLPPFAALQVFSVYSGMTATTVLGSRTELREYPEAYSVRFNDVKDQRQFGATSAGVAGAVSRQMFDDTAADYVKTFAGCSPTAAYCARTTFPECLGMGCTVNSEIFRGLKVKGSDALVEHGQIDREVHWRVTWFDAQAGVTYSLTTANGANPPEFTGIAAKNLAGAQQLTATAEQLVPWTGT
jgi:hypothetical protein